MSERNFTILDHDITIAEGATVVEHGEIPISTNGITAQATFTFGSGGTTVKAYLQTSVDNGDTWFDIISFAFAGTTIKTLYNLSGNTPKTTAVVPTDGTLTDNTSIDGLIGSLLRIKYVTTGTYASTNIKVDIRLHN